MAPPIMADAQLLEGTSLRPLTPQEYASGGLANSYSPQNAVLLLQVPRVLEQPVTNETFFEVPEKPKTRPRWAGWEYSIGAISESELVQKFIEWRDQPVYVGYIPEGESRIFFFKGLKRGDPQYCGKVKQKVFESIKDFVKDHPNLLHYKFGTLTIETHGETPEESYLLTKKHWNKLLTLLRYHYPKCKVLRVYELQERGIVHVHFLMYGAAYIPKSKLESWWGLGFVDIQKPRSIKGIISYLGKYFAKSIHQPKQTAFFWGWGARQWAMTFPVICLVNTSLTQKSFGGLGAGCPHRYGVGAVWWGDGRPVRLKLFSDHGFRGWEWYADRGDYRGVAMVVRRVLEELKGDSIGRKD